MELCQASGGVPRDFINIYRAATVITANRAMSSTLTTNRTMSGRARPPFELITVREAAKSVYQGKRASFGRSASASPQLRLLDRIYQEIYVKKHSYLFLLSEEYAESDVVQTLYMERLIHRWPAIYYNPYDEHRYQYFQLDYGSTIERLIANIVKDAGASYENSLWAKVGSIGNMFLAHTWINETGQDPNSVIAAYTALFQQAAGGLDINPREIIFHPGYRSSKTGSRGRHRRV
jgi:hypothetical protein